MTTQSSVGTLAGDLDSILRSFGSMLEGVYHIDEELASEIAEKFSNRRLQRLVKVLKNLLGSLVSVRLKQR